VGIADAPAHGGLSVWLVGNCEEHRSGSHTKIEGGESSDRRSPDLARFLREAATDQARRGWVTSPEYGGFMQTTA
jgi:hypothetical protein